MEFPLCLYHRVGSTVTVNSTEEKNNYLHDGWVHNPVEFLSIPEPEAIQDDDVNEIGTDGFACSVCGKVCKNALGLAGHKRSHKEV